MKRLHLSPKRLEFQPGVFVTTLRALPKLGTASDRIEVLATNATEGGLPSGMLKQRVIPSVIKQPQAEKNRGNQQAKYNGGGDEIHLVRKCSNHTQVQTEPQP